MLVVVFHSFLFFVFFFILLLLLFFISLFLIWCCSSHRFSTSSLTLPPPLTLPPGFYTHFILSAQPNAEWFVTLSFEPFRGLLSQFYGERYGFEWAFFTHRHFFTLCFFTNILPVFIKASLGAGSSSLKFAGFHTDPRSTGPALMFVLFTVIHNLRSQNDSFLNSTKQYHKSLVVKV